MQREIKKTKITVREDWPTSVASDFYGANVGCIAFNLEYVVRRDPSVAVELIELYEKCHDLRDKPLLKSNDHRFEDAYSKLKVIIRK